MVGVTKYCVRQRIWTLTRPPGGRPALRYEYQPSIKPARTPIAKSYLGKYTLMVTMHDQQY